MRICGQSMAPALTPGQLVVIDEGVYASRTPRRGEIVAATPRALGGRAIVKRLAGLPHDRLEANGRQWRLAEGEYFLVGDSQAESTDSRTFGPVKAAELIGPVTRCVWPWMKRDNTLSGESNEASGAAVTIAGTCGGL